MDPEMAVEALPLGDSYCKCIPKWLRIILFLTCLICGFIMASSALGKCEDMGAFYALWIIGVLAAFLSTMFIKTFKEQWKHMTSTIDNKICCIIVPIGFIVNIVIEAFSQHWYSLIVPYIITFVALIWYNLSLIPGVQRCMHNCLFGCCKGKEEVK